MHVDVTNAALLVVCEGHVIHHVTTIISGKPPAMGISGLRSQYGHKVFINNTF